MFFVLLAAFHREKALVNNAFRSGKLPSRPLG